MNTIFNALNFTLGNEDNHLEHKLLSTGLNHVMCVAGSGVPPMALLSKSPRILSCVDTAIEQLYMTELRIETARQLSYESFLSFWSYPGFTIEPHERKSLFDTLILRHETKRFFIIYFEKVDWCSILYAGRFEKIWNITATPFRLLMGNALQDMFHLSNLEEQRTFLKTKFPKKRFEIFIFFAAFLSSLSLKILKDIIHVNIKQSMYEFYHNIYYSLLQNFYIKENFLLQFAFTGKLVSLEACPPECNPAIFSQIKKNIETCDIRYIHGDILDAAKNCEELINFIDLSNVPSFFKGEREQLFLQEIKPMLDKKALVLNRYHLHIPEGIDSRGFNNITQDIKDIINNEATQLYNIELYENL
jgi:S-adenosylmethionine-diacylglycerol 3-amino-3-carboxypropyl transferase